ncbi:Dehydrogenase/reductase SDR family member 11 [Orchesella cincta]|uniref:Dehydrogenase/reductase SDR family member 11 n=1 Tax=Orchesella cincta TaxID=48709 RepID=A0A1D2MGE6_ORCCI|nr:Dehydrogenase/reductase SDR family member 11 [Orchesella cincta]
MSLPSISRWENRNALVTGASSGIGSAICEAFVKHGINVIGCGQEIMTGIQALAATFVEKKYPGKLIPYKCDISKDDELEKMFEWIKPTIMELMFVSITLEMTGNEMREMMGTNVIGLAICTSKAVKSMKERGVNDGHIFNINSLSGHRLTSTDLNFYSATKYAVTALTEGFRRELVENSKIKVTSISPGFVETEFVGRMYNDEQKAKDIYATVDVLKPNDIADIVLFALSGPPNVQVER